MNIKPKQQNKLLESYNAMQEEAEKNGLNQEILDKEEKELIEAI